MTFEDDYISGVQSIWKITLAQIPGVFEIETPRGAEILSANEQSDHVAIWFRCDPTTALRTKRKIALVMTGSPAPSRETGKFIATVLCDHGSFVLHVFEERRDERNPA